MMEFLRVDENNLNIWTLHDIRFLCKMKSGFSSVYLDNGYRIKQETVKAAIRRKLANCSIND